MFILIVSVLVSQSGPGYDPVTCSWHQAEDLQCAFAPYGNIQSVKVIKDKGGMCLVGRVFAIVYAGAWILRPLHTAIPRLFLHHTSVCYSIQGNVQ